MKEALEKAFDDRTDGAAASHVDRILEAAFFRKRPLQAGSAPVIDLDDRRQQPRR
jgi:hypothetical protein